MTPAAGASGGGGAGRRSGGKGGGGGRGRGRGRGTNERSERSSSAAVAAPPTDDAPRPSNAKGKHDKSKRKPTSGGGGGGGSNANQQRTSSNARPTRAVNAVVRKVLIRNIPHTTDEEEIWTLVEAHGITKDSLWRFVPGKVRGNNRQPTTGRMYLDLKKDSEQARKLIAALNGHVLNESKEGQVSLEVEFAPYQKIPREKQRKDAKMGTIDRDPEYLAFLEELAKPKEKLPSAELVADSTETTEVVEKPIAALVKYMNERKMHSRDKGKGKNGKPFEKGGAAKRQTRKKEKSTKEKTKTPKDRRKSTEATTDASKPRKARGTRNTSKKESPVESVEPGMVRIMAPKAASSKAAASESSAFHSAQVSNAKSSASSVSAPGVGAETKDKGKKEKSGGGGAGGAGGRGKNRGSERPPKEAKPAKASNGGENGAGGGRGEPKNQRRRDSRASAAGGGNVGGKKEGAGKAGGERKKKVFVPKESNNQSG